LRRPLRGGIDDRIEAGRTHGAALALDIGLTAERQDIADTHAGAVAGAILLANEMQIPFVAGKRQVEAFGAGCAGCAG
ncbi:hypothetical protein DQE84_20135, partial [Staphylococcus warneri]